MIFNSHVSLLQVSAFLILSLIFFLFLLRALVARTRETGGRSDGRSRVGILLQSLGIACAGFGFIAVRLGPPSTINLIETAAVVVLMGGSVALFALSSRALGRNWSLVARTRSDHELVRSGPYAHVRHPIYLGMLLFLIAMAVAFRHWPQLLVAIPIFLVGTRIRTRLEDQLLEQSFGQEFIAYRNSTPALLPRLSA
jgi:protein-S-isoprenylcysteine O-methyltransferase Ste14